MTRVGRGGASVPSKVDFGLAQPVFPLDGVVIVSHESVEAEMAVQERTEG